MGELAIKNAPNNRIYDEFLQGSVRKIQEKISMTLYSCKTTTYCKRDK